MAAEVQTPADLLSVPDVVHIINHQVSALFASQGRLGRIRVTGRLGTLKAYQFAAYADLRAASGSSDSLSLEIPSRIPAKNFEGKEVEVTGFLVAKAKNRLEVQLQVTDLVNASGMDQAQLEEEKAFRAIFGKANAGPDGFPRIGNLVVSYLHGRTSQVKADFLEQLEDISPDFLEPEAIPVNITDPGSIRDGLARARGQVVCILRGGGGDGEFEVFNFPGLLEAWRDKDAFKITALGHTANTTLLDRFSHKVSNTPTEAGAWLREQVDLQYDRLYWKNKAEDAGKNTAAAVQKANEEAGKRLEALNQQYAESLKRATEDGGKNLETFTKANEEAGKRLESLRLEAADTLRRVTFEASQREEQQRAAHERILGETLRAQTTLQDQVRGLQGQKEALARDLAVLRGIRAPLPRWVWPTIVATAWFGLLLGWLSAR